MRLDLFHDHAGFDGRFGSLDEIASLIVPQNDLGIFDLSGESFVRMCPDDSGIDLVSRF
jgi:hypothetical protein